MEQTREAVISPALPFPARDLSYVVPSHRRAFESSFGLLPASPEESQLQRARAVLGETAAGVPDGELAASLTRLQCLLDGWLDAYERQLFSGITLQELLRER